VASAGLKCTSRRMGASGGARTAATGRRRGDDYLRGKGSVGDGWKKTPVAEEDHGCTSLPQCMERDGNFIILVGY